MRICSLTVTATDFTPCFNGISLVWAKHSVGQSSQTRGDRADGGCRRRSAHRVTYGRNAHSYLRVLHGAANGRKRIIPDQVQYHAASALIVVLLGIQFVFLRPAWKRLHTAVETGINNTESETNGDEASMHARKISMYAGFGHLFWLVLLVLMFWNRLMA